jgi:HprK-related kinase A
LTEVSAQRLSAKLIKEGKLVVRIGPFNVRVQSEITPVQQGIAALYQDYPVLETDAFSDFFVRVFRPSGLRYFFRKQALFAFDQFLPFKPLPYSQALPFFEWGLNWCISGYAHQFLVIHAAVVEKNSRALIFPGFPGSGKSTLCAALINEGWRLLSDELTLVDRVTGNIVPIPRPVSLKNQSIELIKRTYPRSEFSKTVQDTLKGSVGLMKPPTESVKQAGTEALPYAVIFPLFQAGSQLTLTPVPKAKAFMMLADLSFNYNVLGASGFKALTQLVAHCGVYDFVYGGDFNQALACFDELLFKQPA